MKKSQDDKLVVRAFVTYQGKVLLLQRDYSRNLDGPGLWQLPGGGIETGEKSDEAMRRELEEEISLTPKIIHFLCEIIPGKYLYHAPLSATEARTVKKGFEGKDLKFFLFFELPKIPLTPLLKATLATNWSFFQSLVNPKF